MVGTVLPLYFETVPRFRKRMGLPLRKKLCINSYSPFFVGVASLCNHFERKRKDGDSPATVL
jgi:hypothetical protein